MSRTKQLSALARAAVNKFRRAKEHPPLPQRFSDAAWYQLQFNPVEARKTFGVPLPDLPPDEVQLRFTGRTTQEALAQAFQFYLHVKKWCPASFNPGDRILDFGGGWGRIARFFLRELPPSQILIADCLRDAVEWLQRSGNPCRSLYSNPAPPLPVDETEFSLIYAFSVFSHLSEEYLHRWLSYFGSILRPDGRLVFTSRASAFLQYLESLPQTNPGSYLLSKLPPSAEVRARFIAGEFQFYPTGGGGELTPEFYGEAFVPRGYLERTAARYGLELIDFTEAVPNVDQSVAILRKRRC